MLIIDATAHQLQEARTWLRDLDGEASFGFEDQESWEAWVASRTDERIWRLVEKTHEGGWAGFVGCAVEEDY